MSFVRVSAHACSVREMLMIYRICGGDGVERSPEKLRNRQKMKRVRYQGDTRTQCQGERECCVSVCVCVCLSKAREDENEMFLRPSRGKKSFYVDSGETSLKGICQSNVPVSWE